jgi:hypothetical protein
MNQRERMRQRSRRIVEMDRQPSGFGPRTCTFFDRIADRPARTERRGVRRARANCETLKGELANLLTEEGLSNNAAATVREKIDAGTVTFAAACVWKISAVKSRDRFTVD